MKQLLFIALLICTMNSTAQIPVDAGQDKTIPAQVVPPQAIVDKFIKEYPGITPSWRMDGKNFQAEFVNPTTFKGNVIVYDKDGNVIRRENEMENASYPPNINTYFIKKYPGEKFKTWTTQNENGEETYYIKRNNEIVWFDKNGNYISPAK